MDRLTDAWRAGWRGGVVNGVRREALPKPAAANLLQVAEVLAAQAQGGADV